MNPGQWKVHASSGAQAAQSGDGRWRLLIPPGEAHYRVAQVDDYSGLPRGRFPQAAPFALQLRARVSAADLPGTWGFGLWNDPFGMGLGQGAGLRLPALPNAAWFFYASPPNYLALRESHPAQGFLAAVFCSVRIPGVLMLPAAPGLGLLAWPAAARLIRRLAARLVQEDAAGLKLDPTGWHTYRIEWRKESAIFGVDGATVFESTISPQGRLGLVIWVDNQYAAFPPDGRIRAGVLGSEQAAWMEVEQVSAE